MKALLLPLGLMVALVMALLPSVGSAAAPPPRTPRPTPTATPTATTIPRPTPSPSPTPPALVGVSSDTACAAGLHIPLPLGQGVCVDIWGVIQQGWAAFWGGVASILATQIRALTDAILAPLTRTDNPTANHGLAAVETTLASDATDAFAVVFGVAVLWVARPGWFGTIAEGIALLWRSALVLAALRSYDTLVNVWLGAVNALARDIGAATMHDLGHSGIALLLAPVLLIVVGLERAVTLHVFAFMYEIGPLALVLFAWPPAADIGRAWLRAFAYLSLLGPAYALMLSVIVSLEGQGNGRPGGPIGGIVWNDIMLVGGLLVLALVPAIVAGLLSAVSHAGAGGLEKVIATGAKIAAL